MRDNVDSAGGGSVFFFAVPYLPDSLDDSSLSADLADVEAEVRGVYGLCPRMARPGLVYRGRNGDAHGTATRTVVAD